VLSPQEVSGYMEAVLAREPRIAVAGIAGPGDPFANAKETLETLRLLREKFPHLLLCLSTNGLRIGDYMDEIAKIGISHVTITVNAVDPEIGRKVYGWVRDGKVIHRGLKGAELLLSRQTAAIRRLKNRGVTVKVNTIVVPSVNDHHIEDIARTLADLGVDLLNCMPIYPNKDTPFEHIEEPGGEMMEEIRTKAGRYLPQMHHCTRCRADAAGLLEEDRSSEFRAYLRQNAGQPIDLPDRPYVAVATMEGVLVNQHLGEAYKFQIWSQTPDGLRCIEERMAPEPGGGIARWKELAMTLKDCRAILVSGIGESPMKLLTQYGIAPIEMTGFIEPALEAVYSGRSLSAFKVRRQSGCSRGLGCVGSGDGC
jgi:nitrogen fixation protein NifB